MLKPHKARCIIFIIVFLLVIFATPLSRADTLNQESPAGDTWVCSALPTTNYGSAYTLMIVGFTNWTSISYFKFSTNLADVTSLDFSFVITSQNTSQMVNIWTCTTNWSESSVTYNTKPLLLVKIGEKVISTSTSDMRYFVNIKNYISSSVFAIAIVPCMQNSTFMGDCLSTYSKETGFLNWALSPYIERIVSPPSVPQPFPSWAIFVIIGIIIAIVIFIVIRASVRYSHSLSSLKGKQTKQNELKKYSRKLTKKSKQLKRNDE